MYFKKFTHKFQTCLLFFYLIPLGSGVTLSWRPNSEPDLMGYRVYLGTASRAYHTVIDVGKVTEYKFDHFSRDGRYFFAVTAYDSAGNESGFSKEVTVYIRTSGKDSNTVTGDSVSVYNFPNPFKPEKEVTNIRYNLLTPGRVSIRIYNVSNELIRTLIDTEEKSPGEHLEDFWDGKDEKGRFMPNGVYFAVLKTNQFTRIIKIVIAR